MATILLKDWGRRFQNTGYGQLSRSIAISLINYSDHTVVFSSADNREFSEGIPQQDVFKNTKIIAEKSYYEYDAMLCVCPPSPLPQIQKPIILYTQNALGGLKAEWTDHIAVADRVVVPGEFDQHVFLKVHKNVDICPQVVDYNFYQPLPRYREEGPKRLSFLFVGSFSYRKGVDLISDIFSKASSGYGLGECEVHLHCFSGIEGDNPTHLIELGRQLPRDIALTASSGALTVPWMRRKLNRYDIVFTFSRGEGWCMPLWEALYSGIPVVAPNSTAMGEFLPEKGVCLFDVDEKPVSEIQTPFGSGFKKAYGEPSITFYEAKVDSAAAAIAKAVRNFDQLKSEALQNREELIDRFSYARMGQLLSETISKTLFKT